ncbi:MAG: ankyrin repeat domain-containing protein [Deltaproteobacteria bacterium]|jgi:ankyrin repeat protein|nr:ankyrin repeat domain-containing protein [Deltaproteobacteria bacterium]
MILPKTLKNKLIFLNLGVFFSVCLWAALSLAQTGPSVSENKPQTPTSNKEAADSLSTTEVLTGEKWLEFCTQADPNQLKSAIKNGAAPNFKTPNGLTPLMSAAGFNPNPDSIRVLLDNKAEPQAVELKFGLNALMFASAHNTNPKVITLLAQTGIDPSFQNYQGGTALIQAAANNPNPEIIQALIEAKADVNASDSQGATALMHAAAFGKMPVVKRLISLKADLKAQDKKGDTALFWAAKNNPNPDVIQFLLQAGLKVNSVNKLGETPLFYASTNPNPLAVTTLINAGANAKVKDQTGSTALFTACLSNTKLDTLRTLLSLGLNVNEVNDEGVTPLMAAAANPEISVTRYLLIEGADPNLREKRGRTALMLAAALNPNPMVLRILLECGADPLIKDSNNQTALYFASQNLNSDMLQVLNKFTTDQTTSAQAQEKAPEKKENLAGANQAQEKEGPRAPVAAEGKK